MRRRACVALLVLLAVAVSGCGGAGQPKTTPTVLGVPNPVSTSQGQVKPVATGYATVAARPPESTPVARPPIPVATIFITPTPSPITSTLSHLQLNGDSQRAIEVLEQWKEASLSVGTVRASQSLAVLKPDGSRPPLPVDRFNSITSTDEWYDWRGAREESQVFYKVVAHSKRGDFTTLYNAQGAYRTWSWINEVFRPWPERYAPNAYWTDDVDDMAMFNSLFPTGSEYSFVGRSNVDGRVLDELVVKAGNISPAGMTGMHIFLDAATHMPYRFVNAPDKTTGNRGEITLTRLEINLPLKQADFGIEIAPGTPIIYEPAYMAAVNGDRLPVYPDMQSAQQAAGFALYGPKDGVQGNITTWEIVEKDGKRTPVLALDNGTIREGTYLSVTGDSRFGLRFSDTLGDYTVEKVDVNGQPAEWRIDSGGGSSLHLQLGSTQIEIRSQSKEQAIQVAGGLKPVK